MMRIMDAGKCCVDFFLKVLFFLLFFRQVRSLVGESVNLLICVLYFKITAD